MSSSFTAYWRNLADGTRSSSLDRLLLMLLIPLALPYALAQRLRAGLYHAGILKTKKLPRPVVSIGNLTVGGTGKTPVTAWIARFLIAQGLRVAVLSRGYGGTLEGQAAVASDGCQILLTAEECGDEPYLLAKGVPGLMVIIGSDRYSAGLLAMERLSPDIFLLDDGFQHLRLQPDLNILLLDCTRPFGNGWTLPAGLLREPVNCAARADLVILTRCPDEAQASPVLAGIPWCTARHRLSDIIPLSGGGAQSFDDLQGRRVLAFAGIAEPRPFFDELAGQGLNLVGTLTFPDHVCYDNARISELAAMMRNSGADCAVTTEKDGVKLGHLPPELAQKTVLARLEVSLNDPSLLVTLLYNLLQK